MTKSNLLSKPSNTDTIHTDTAPPMREITKNTRNKKTRQPGGVESDTPLTQTQQSVRNSPKVPDADDCITIDARQLPVVLDECILEFAALCNF
jgi:hypothetical protein